MQQALRRSSLVPTGFVVESAFYEADRILITVRAVRGFSLCPACGTVSRRGMARVRSIKRPVCVGCLFVEVRRVLLRLEAIGIVRHEHAGAFRIAHPPYPRIGIEHAGRLPMLGRMFLSRFSCR